MELSGYHVWLGLDRLKPLLKDSWLKYSQLDAFIRLTGAEDAFRYIELYQKHPQLEYIMKMGLWNIIAEAYNATVSGIYSTGRAKHLRTCLEYQSAKEICLHYQLWRWIWIHLNWRCI